MTKSCFDRAAAEGNLLGSLGQGLHQGAGITPFLAVELLVLCLREGAWLTDNCGAQEPDGSVAGSVCSSTSVPQFPHL